MIWLSYKIPAQLSFIFALGLACLIWWAAPSKELIIEKPVTIQLPGCVDTLIVRPAPDTIFINKVLRVEVPVYVTKKEDTIREAESQGSSMAELQELDDFLVSSSLP